MNDGYLIFFYLKTGSYCSSRSDKESVFKIYNDFLKYVNDLDKAVNEGKQPFDRWFDFKSQIQGGKQDDESRLFIRFGYVAAITIYPYQPPITEDLVKSQKKLADTIVKGLDEGDEWKKKEE